MEQLVGNWRLVEWTARIGDRSVTPFGGETTGLLTYTADGRMWGSLMRVDRDTVSAPTLAAATADERARAAAGYLNYAGSYRVEGSEVIHSVEMSLYPNWIGGEQRRVMEWEGVDANELALSAAYVDAKGEVVTNRLVWRRIESQI